MSERELTYEPDFSAAEMPPAPRPHVSPAIIEFDAIQANINTFLHKAHLDHAHERISDLEAQIEWRNQRIEHLERLNNTLAAALDRSA